MFVTNAWIKHRGNKVTEKQINQRQKALCRSNGLCPVCKKPLAQGQMQYAHKIPQKEMYIKKYGSWVIDHTLNGELVCSIPCNQTIDTGSSYGNHLEVIADILIYEYKKMWSTEGLGKLADKITAEYNLLNKQNAI
jgi:5-methylcytosine-specific restriction endonuclease McrA